MQLNTYFQLLINLRNIKLIQVRQAGFYSVKISVSYEHHSQIVNATPIEQNKLNFSQNAQIMNISHINKKQQTYQTHRFLIRFPEGVNSLDQTCIFKGQLDSHKINKKIKITYWLISHILNQTQIIDQWEGHLFYICSHTCFSVYMFTYSMACSIETSIHSIVSEVKIANYNIQNALKLEQNWCCSFQNSVPAFKKIYDEHLKLITFSYINLWQQIERFINYNEQQQQLKNIKQQLQKNTIIQLQYNSIKKQYKINNNQKLIDIENYINKINQDKLIKYIQQDIQYIVKSVQKLWNLFIKILIKYNHQNYYFYQLKKIYYSQLQNYKYQNQISILNINNSKQKYQIKNCKIQNLIFYPFKLNNTQLKINLNDFNKLKNINKKQKNQFFVLVHGYQATSFDMEFINMFLKCNYSDIVTMVSSINQGRTQQNIEDSAHRLAIEIKNFINSKKIKDFQINFICHSMGGLIVRASLKYLQKYKNQMKSFISINVPHLGYLFHQSNLVKTGIWIMNNLQKNLSLLEMSMNDSAELKNTYLYKLSSNIDFSWFQHITLIASEQDHYVPFESALLKSKQFYFQTQSSKIYQEMYSNLFGLIQQKLVRIQINFNDSFTDISTLIGRTAHIKLLNHMSSIELIFSFLSPMIN